MAYSLHQLNSTNLEHESGVFLPNSFLSANMLVPPLIKLVVYCSHIKHGIGRVKQVSAISIEGGERR